MQTICNTATDFVELTERTIFKHSEEAALQWVESLTTNDYDIILFMIPDPMPRVLEVVVGT